MYHAGVMSIDLSFHRKDRAGRSEGCLGQAGSKCGYAGGCKPDQEVGVFSQSFVHLIVILVKPLIFY